jgi:2-hydroxychromene-2-carboxylate isomerase
MRQAIEKGIFGAPWIIVDGESFWGNDRCRKSNDGLLREASEVKY